MKYVALILLLAPYIAFAKDCSEDDKSRLLSLVSESKLVSQKNEGKLLKFTQHDYPIWCAINIGNTKYKMYRSKGSPYYFFELDDGTQEKYFGLYKFEGEA